MTGTLLLTAALMGAAATPHCAAMCAGACRLTAQRCADGDGAGGRRALLLGRIAGYAVAGAAAAGLGSTVRWLADAQPWLRPIWLILQLAVLMLGANLLLRGRLPLAVQDWLGRGTRQKPASSDRTQPIHWHRTARAAGAGTLWFLLPCGVLHAALVVAALASDPAEGALVMAAFGLASTPGLLVGTWLWAKASQPPPAGTDGAPFAPAGTSGSPGPQAATWSLRLAGAGIVATSAWSVAMAIWTPLQAAWCA
jgi:sulfite exporter TauE/SafE